MKCSDKNSCSKGRCTKCENNRHTCRIVNSDDGAVILFERNSPTVSKKAKCLR